jgi:hypothetical protein
MRSLIRYTAIVALIAAGAALLAPRTAWADDQATFNVIVVKATNDGNSMDASLSKYAHLLKGKGYTNFTKVRSTSLTLAKGKSGTVQITGSLKAILKYRSEVNDRVAFTCSVFKGSARQTHVGFSIPRGGKSIVVVDGEPGYILIITVT